MSTNDRLEFFALPGLPLIEPGDDLAALIVEALEAAALNLKDGDVLVIAQKPVSKAEGRLRRLSEVRPGAEARALAAAADKDPAMTQLILDESRAILRQRPGVIISEHLSGVVLANAGIDRSNVSPDRDWVLLLPEDSDASAQALRSRIMAALGVSIGVIIADSVGRAWRMGTIGMALGCAGVEALVNLRGRRDMFGRVLEVSEHAVADAIAAAAELVLGEADEATPVVIARGLRQGHSTQDSTVLLRPAADDMFR
ncbi:MAG: coenzyme F420-0:L-glutamate ligase [Gammaproteobacteria bacterium]|nr:coenzyme F420-0:L-glutamate ligase [Gammaproteobacteria bacterium]